MNIQTDPGWASKALVKYQALILDDLNNRLAAVNRQFVTEFCDCIDLGPRLSIGEALLCYPSVDRGEPHAGGCHDYRPGWV
jgi:hypothetical protein